MLLIGGIIVKVFTNLEEREELSVCNAINSELELYPHEHFIELLDDIKICSIHPTSPIEMSLLYKSVESLLNLRALYDSNELKVIVENWFKSFILNSIIEVKIIELQGYSQLLGNKF